MNTERGKFDVEMLKALSAHPFTRGLSERHLCVIAETAMRKEFEKDEQIFREGDPANRFYLIMEGSVALKSRRENQESVLVQELGAGEVLGWSWLFPPYVWQFDARASSTQPTKAIFFYGTRLREQCETDPVLGYELMKKMTEIVIKRLQATRDRLIDREAA